MFEKEIKFIVDFSLNRVKQLGTFIAYEKLASSGLHPAILHYISSELDYLIYEDRLKLLSNSAFDYSGPVITKHFNLISEEIKRNKKLSFEDVKKLIIQAVSFNVNYLTRPNWSLGKLIYDGNESRSVNEIRMVLNFIYYYDHIKTVFHGYFSKRKLVQLSRSEFDMILTKMDNELFTSQGSRLIENALGSISDFFNIGEVNKTKISASHLEMFLKEKNQLDYLTKLRKAIPSEGKQIFGIDDIRNALFASSPVKEELPEEELKPSDEVPLTIPAEPEIPEDDIVIEKESTVSESTDEITSEEPESVSVQEEFSEAKETHEKSTVQKEEIESEKSDNEEQEQDIFAVYDAELKKLEEQGFSLSSELEKLDLDFSIDEHLKSIYELDEELKKEEEKLKADLNLPEKQDEQKNADEESSSGSTTSGESIIETIGEEQPSSPPENLSENEITDESDDTTSSEDRIDIEEVFQPESEEHEKEQQPLIDEEISDVETEENIPQDSDAPKLETQTEANSRREGKDVFSFLSSRDTEKIIVEVFNEDEEDFTNTMEKIYECGTYSEAAQILKDVYFTYRVNPFSKSAIVLTEAVEKYFGQAG